MTRHGMSLRFIGITGEPPEVTLRRVAIADLRRNGAAALDTIDPIISGEVA